MFTLLLSFVLARFARQYYKTYYIYTYFQVQCSVLNGYPFSNISLIKIMKRTQLPISCFYERAFSYFSSLELHDFTPFKPKIFWGIYIYNIKNYYVWLCREALNYKKTMIYALLQQKGKNNLNPLFSLPFFSVACQNFRKVRPPIRKFLDPCLSKKHNDAIKKVRFHNNCICRLRTAKLSDNSHQTCVVT